MGLLSKAAAGTSKDDELPPINEYASGGLLKLVSQKNQNKTKKDTAATNTEENVFAPFSPSEKAIMEKLSNGYAKFGVFQGLVIEALKYSAGEFTSRLSLMVSDFGAAQGLAPGRALVLFSSVQDGELIEKHLVKTVPGNSIFSFQANTPQEAFSLLKPYL